MFISLIFSFLNFQSIYSQCTNSTPTGDAIQNFCKNDNKKIADLNANGGTIVWYDSLTGGEVYNNNELLVNGTYYADDISNNNCSTTRLAVTVNIYGDAPKDVNVFVGKCATQNATIGDLTATGTNIEWYDAQFDGNLLPSTHLLEDNTTYWVQQTENGCTSSRLPTQVTIIDPPAPSTTTNQSFCSANSPTVGDLQATTTSLLWYDTENSTLPLDNTTPLIDGEDYWVVENSFPCESSTRNRTVVAIDEAPDAGVSSVIPICESQLKSINFFTELGGTPEIDGVWTGPSELGDGYLGSFDPDVNVEGTYTYTVTSELEVCSPATATIELKILKPQPPTISQSTQTFCIDQNATVANLSSDGADVYWYDNADSKTPLNDTDALENGEDYFAAQVDAATGCESALRAVINVVIENPEPPTITNTTQQFCEIDNATVNDLAATGENISWYDAEDSIDPLDTTTALVDNQVYWASTTSATGCEGAKRNSVAVTIIKVLPPTVTITNQEFCAIDAATVADLKATGEGIVWYDDVNATTPLDIDTPLSDEEDYWATQVNSVGGCESVSRTVVTVTINDITPPTTSASTQTFCLPDLDPNLPTIASLDISGNAILWYDAEDSTIPLNETDLLQNGEYWASQTSSTTNCESSLRTKVNVVLLNPTPPSTTNVNQVFCLVNNPTVENLDVTGDNILWYESEDSINPLDSTTPLEDDEDYWAEANDSSNSCTSNFRLRVVVSIEDSLPVTINNSNQSFCTSNSPTVNDLEAEGTNVQWFESQDSTDPLATTDALIDGEDYWASQLNANDCLSSVRKVVNVTLNNPGTPSIIAAGNEFCVIDNPTLADLNVRVSANNTNSEIKWYTSYPNGSELSLSEMLTEGTSYFAVEVNEDDCTSTIPLEVIVTLESCEEYDVETYDGFSPNGNSINDTYTIKNLRELYPDFKVEFYNRWGELVYETNANKPDWNGRLNGDGVLVPAGVYYYIIYFNKNNRKPIQKKLYLNR